MGDVGDYSKARYDGWLSAIFVVSLLVTLVIGVILLGTGETVGGLILLAVTAFNLLVFWCVLPRWYEIRSDRLRIVLGWPFAVNIPFNTIAQIPCCQG